MIRGIYSLRFWLLVCALTLSRVVVIAGDSVTGAVNNYYAPVTVTGSVTVTGLAGGVVTSSGSLNWSRWDTNTNGTFGWQVDIYNSTGSLLIGSCVNGESFQIPQATLETLNNTVMVKAWTYVSPSNNHEEWVSALIEFPTCQPQAPEYLPVNGQALVLGQAQNYVAGGVHTYAGSITLRTGQGNITNAQTGPGSSSGNFTFTPTASEPWSVEVVFIQMDGFCESRYVVSGTTSDPVYCDTLTYQIPADAAWAHPVLYRARRISSDPALDNTIIDEWTLPANTLNFVKTIGPKPFDGAYVVEYLKFIVHSYDSASGSWYKPVGGVVTVAGDWQFEATRQLKPCGQANATPSIAAPVATPGKPDPSNPSQVIPAGPSDPGSGSTPTVAQPTTTGGKLIGGSVWNSVGPENAALTVDKQTFAEGITKLEKQLIAANGGGEDGVTNGQRIGAAAASGAGSTDGSGNGEGSGEAQAGVESAFEAPDIPSFSAAAGGGGGMLSISLGTFGPVVNLDPAENPQAKALMDFLRDVIAWIALLVYTWFAWGEFKNLSMGLAAAPQAKGNAVIGGTGGQITALVAAAAITVIIISFPSLYWAYSNVGSPNVNPFAGASGVISGISLYLLYMMVPVGLILTLIGQAFALRKFGLITTMTLSTAIRFIVP